MRSSWGSIYYLNWKWNEFSGNCVHHIYISNMNRVWIIKLEFWLRARCLDFECNVEIFLLLGHLSSILQSKYEARNSDLHYKMIEIWILKILAQIFLHVYNSSILIAKAFERWLAWNIGVVFSPTTFSLQHAPKMMKTRFNFLSSFMVRPHICSWMIWSYYEVLCLPRVFLSIK